MSDEMNENAFAEQVERMSIAQNRHVYRWHFADIDELRDEAMDPARYEKAVLMVMTNILIIAKQYSELPLIAIPHHRVQTDVRNHDHLDAAHRLLYAKRDKLGEYVPKAHLEWLEAFLDFPFYDDMREQYGSEYGSLEPDRFREEVWPAFASWNQRREDLLRRASAKAREESGQDAGPIGNPLDA